MRRLAPLTAALLALAALVAAPGTVDPASAQAPGPADDVAAADAEIERLRGQAEALSGRYFETLGRLADVQVRIDAIEARIPALEDDVDELRALTRERAVVAYKRAGNDLAAVIDAGDPLEAARRVQWLDRLNARDAAVVADLEAMSARLATQRTELEAARTSAAAALDDVKAQGRAIDALLVDAEERRRIAATPPTTVPPPAPTPAAGAGDPTTTPPTVPPTAPPASPPSYAPTPGTHPAHDEPFLVCTRGIESGGNYQAYNAAGPYMGAYQFLQSTWNSTANHAGRSDLVGVPPNTASPYDQDHLAWALYQWQGSRPWGGRCEPG